MALDNYAINTNDAIRLAETFDFRLIMVMLPIRKDIVRKDPVEADSNTSAFYSDFNSRLRKLSAQLAKTSPHAFFITLTDEYSALLSPNGYFCDSVHQRLAGHILTSQIIEKKLALWLD